MADNDKYFNIHKMNENAVARGDYSTLQGSLENREGRATTDSEGKKRIVGGSLPYVIDGADALANTHFQTIDFEHVPSETSVSFKAFVQALNETYNSDWSEEPIYGRSDPIRMFKQTSRSITLSFIAPAATEGEGFENLAKVQKLVTFLYPNYTDVQNALSVSQSPLVRLKVMNLIGSMSAIAPGLSFSSMTTSAATMSPHGATKGLLGIVSNISINHNIDNPEIGVFATAPGVIIPKAIEIAIDFKVIHEQHLGWDDDSFSSENFPYNVSLRNSEPADKQGMFDAFSAASTLFETARTKEREEQRKNQQLQASRDIAKSHFLNANGDLNMFGKRIQKRLAETTDAANGNGKIYRTGIKDRKKAAYYAGAMAVIGEDGRYNENADALDVESAQEGIGADADALSEMKWSWIR
tara:strand:- start:207 stop:1442 length:1236 start_codon:yes stop_codon:yes gene_type:complete